MADGKHCPNCGKDIGFWPYWVALDAKRIWCPHCLNRLQVVKSKQELLLEWFLIVATGGFAGLFSGMPALISGLIEDLRRFPEDEIGAHLLAFLCLWVCLLILVHLGRATIRRKYLELAPVPCIRISGQASFRRCILLSPRALRWFLGALFCVAIAGILLVCLPVCQQRTLLWRIEKAGAAVRLSEPFDLADLLKGSRRWNEGLYHHATVTLSGYSADDTVMARVAESLADIASTVSLEINETRITAAGISHLRNVRSVAWLKITNSPISDDGLQHLQTMPSLRSLAFKDVPITDDGSWGFTGLGHLSIEGTRVSGSELARLQTLTSLRLANCPVTEGGMASIGAMKNLYLLDVSETPITDDMLVHLQSLDNLMSLKLRKTQLTGTGLQHLDQMAKLVSIDLSGSSITDAGLLQMPILPAVISLNLERSLVTGAGIERLNSMPKLIAIVLNGCPVADSELKCIAEINSLVSLSLNETQITDAGLEQLQKLPTLVQLSVKGTRVTDPGIAQLKVALPKLNVTR